MFEKIENDSGILSSLLKKGPTKMREKLCSFAQKQLPGVCYWDPDQKTKDLGFRVQLTQL